MRLTFSEGVLAGKSFVIARETIIGRSEACTVSIDDDTVSGRQCRFFFQDGRPYIQDLQSTNATVLNGEEVQLAQLHDGDVITMGDSSAIVEMVLQSSIISLNEPQTAFGEYELRLGVYPEARVDRRDRIKGATKLKDDHRAYILPVSVAVEAP